MRSPAVERTRPHRDRPDCGSILSTGSASNSRSPSAASTDVGVIVDRVLMAPDLLGELRIDRVFA